MKTVNLRRLEKLEARRTQAELAPFIARHGVPVIRSQDEATAWRAQSPCTRWAEVLILGTQKHGGSR